jgi:rhodanese-related sulfurtransferase
MKMKKLFLVLSITFLFVSCNLEKGIDIKDINQNCKANAFSAEQMADLLYTDGINEVAFIDIRTPHDYAMEHLPNAINVPMANFFSEKYFSKIPKDKVLVLYGYDASSPRLMALLSGHFNKGKFYVALGGYDYLKKHILDGYSLYSGLYNDEEPLVDFQQVINEIKSRAGGTSTRKTVKAAKPSKPIVKRKKKEVSGGCG